MPRCANCGANEPKIIAAIPDRPAIDKLLAHLGLQVQPPRRSPARETAPLHAS